MSSHWSRKLQAIEACGDAVEWARTQPSYEAAWKSCKRGDWMLWLAGKLCGEKGSSAHRAVVLAACACARLSLKYVPKGEKCPLAAIETAERWARGEDGVTLDMVRAAHAAAYAYTAAYAAYAAAEDAYAAAYAAYAAAYAATAADAAEDAAAASTLAGCASIVRKMVKRPELKGGGE